MDAAVDRRLRQKARGGGDGRRHRAEEVVGGPHRRHRCPPGLSIDERREVTVLRVPEIGVAAERVASLAAMPQSRKAQYCG